MEDIRLSEEAEETEAIVASVSRIRFIVVCYTAGVKVMRGCLRLHQFIVATLLVVGFFRRYSKSNPTRSEWKPIKTSFPSDNLDLNRGRLI